MSDLGPVSAYVRQRLAQRLDEKRVVVWYDGERTFQPLLARLDLPRVVVISAAASPLRARREADAAYRRLNEPGGGEASRQHLLIYVPAARGVSAEQRNDDPFEVFACCGGVFGVNEAESLHSLAQGALPQGADEISRLFREGRPTLAFLDALPTGASYPLVRQAIGVDSPAEALALVLADQWAAEQMATTAGALLEFARLAAVEIGFAGQPGEAWPLQCARLGRFLLLSELAFLLPGGLPATLDGVAIAPADRRDRVLAVCERLRMPGLRAAYSDLAEAVERELPVRAAVAAAGIARRDTFPSQEMKRLQGVATALVGVDLPAARSLLEADKASLWREAEERALLWRAAERCLHFLETASALDGHPPPRDLHDLITVYSETDGLWRLDRAQRLFEQAAAQCRYAEEVATVIAACRARYLEMTAPWQATFQAAVEREGWPPEAVKRQTQVFDLHVAPDLAERRKTAYVLVDSLRYEMGRDLADALAALGAVRVEVAATVLPPITPFGMAALLPGADGALTLVQDGADLDPAINGTPLPDLAARKAFVKARFGDRVLDLTVEEALQLTPARRRQVTAVDLLIVRSRDIDSLGDSPSLFQARLLISEVIGDLKAVAHRLSDLGFSKLVFAADHGHVLLPEIPPGDALSAPPGHWRLRKRRALLGAGQGRTAGTLTLPATHVGIRGPVEELVVPTGFKTFGNGGGYFHEGLSLQECLTPVVVVQTRRPTTAAGASEVTISYRSDRFTSTIIGLKLRATSMLETIVPVRLEAFDGAGPRAQSVGRAADCDARDPATGEITLVVGEDTPVPLVIDPDFQGAALEVRVSDPKTGAIYHRLTLRNARMD